ncbi:MAG: hypothetical protein ACREBO_08490 [Novosphingobium sp.]
MVALVAPLALMLPGAVAVEAVSGLPAAAEAPMANSEASNDGAFEAVATTFRISNAQQVRIEQVLSIRVAPRASTAPPLLLAQLPPNGVAPNMSERKMGRCVAMSGIVGMQYGGDRKLILFLRDHRIVSATLEKACRARDFYSGFYVARNGDGMLCRERDQLQSRSGANCQIDGFKQLVADDD